MRNIRNIPNTTIATYIAVGIAVLIALFSLASCGSPCAGLSATERDKQAAANGYEVEKEGSMGSTCELQKDGSWEVDD